MHIDKDEKAAAESGKDENTIDFQASEGIFPHGIALIFERYIIVIFVILSYMVSTPPQ